MSVTTEASKATPTVTVTVAMFDDRPDQPVYRPLRSGQPITEFAPVTAEDYNPRGMTPLLDATASFIAHVETLRDEHNVTIGLLADESGSMQHNQEPVIRGINDFVEGMSDVDAVDPAAAGKVLAVVLTDGFENASSEVDRDQLRGIISAKEADGWTFIYLGANQDAWGEAGALGLSGRASGQSVNYDASPRGTEAALRSVADHSVDFLADQRLYAIRAARAPQRTLTEDGIEQDPTGKTLQPEPQPYGDVAAALKTAKESTSR